MPGDPGDKKKSSVRLKRPPTGQGRVGAPVRRTPAGSASGVRQRTPGSGSQQSAQPPSGLMPSARPATAVRAAGSVAGRRVQGAGLALKMSLTIACLVVLVVGVWGWFLVNMVSESAYDSIKRYGAAAGLCLSHAGAAEIARYADWRKTASPQEAWRPRLMPDLLYLKAEGTEQPVAADIEDVVIQVEVSGQKPFLIASAKENPKAIQDIRKEPIGGQYYSNVACSKGNYLRGNQLIPALQFVVAVAPDGDRPGGDARLIISAARVEQQVSKVIASAVVAGVLCILAGIAVSYVLASGIIRPVRGLMRDMDVVSRGDFDHVTKPASRDEIGLLASAFNDMTKSLKAARELEHEAERFQGELNTAREIQAHLLPAKIPQLPGFDIYQAYSSAKEVGGDYFDFIPVDRENLGVVVADVSGKGIPGSMVMAQTRAVLRMLATGNPSASATLAQTNAIIARDIKRGMFVTMLYGVLNVRQKTLTVASAGHNPMVLLRARTGAVELVNPAGIALGFDKGPIFNRTIKEQIIQLYKGDRAVLYTDGVVEAMNEKHEEFTDERFYKWVQTNARELRSRDLVAALLKELDAHRGRAEQHDDITVVTIRVE